MPVGRADQVMKKLAYLECPTGIAGDMCLGALVHAGVPLEYLVGQLARLGISQEYRLWTEPVLRNGQQATKFHVDLVAAIAPGLDNVASNSGEPTEPATFAPFHSASDKQPSTPHPTANHHPQPTHHHEPHDHHHGDRNHHHVHPHPDTVESVSAAEHTHARPSEKHVHGRNLPEIEQLITAAKLPPRAEAWSLAVFRRLAAAEGAVHGIAPNHVHFHEVGATDAIVDIVGTCLGLDWLNLDELYCSAMPTGGGLIRAAHGLLPVPTPAVMKLWQTRSVPIYHNGVNRELVTPTGAAIAVTLATRFGPPPAMMLQQVGLGAGSRNLKIPNVLRLWVGEGDGDAETSQVFSFASPASTQQPKAQPEITPAIATPQGPVDALPETLSSLNSSALETVTVLETQVDDLNPQAIGYVLNALLAIGALDVFTQAVGMKKSRPGILLTVICHPEKVALCETILFRETTTLGIRRSNQQRLILERAIASVETAYGPVRVKIAWSGAGADQAIGNVQPEYEDCAQLAQKHHLPWREVHRMALQTWYEQNSNSRLKPPAIASQ